MKRLFTASLLALALSVTLVAPAARAALVDVFAQANSSTGGIGAGAGVLSAGTSFSIVVDPLDLWNAGALPRWSNANGLVGNLFATGSDESGQTAGTLIGIQWPSLHSQGNLTTAFGTLVGRVGGGDYFVVGSTFNGVAAASGLLELFYWDSNAGDNTQFITATVTSVVPLPAAAWLFLAGTLGTIGVARRRRI
ncbi:MAG: hypothetical protein H7125_06085 [Proteobacteria bacterium]|nr:hypothetical protein [Burkholderiales bacterium]